MSGVPQRGRFAWREVRDDEHGSSLIEVALALALLLSVVLATIGMSRLAYAKHFVTFAARQGTRYAAVRGSTFPTVGCSNTTGYACQATSADVTAYVQSQVPLGLLPQNTTVATTWPGLIGSGQSCLSLAGTNSPGCLVRVTVSYAFSFGLPFLPTGATTLQSTSAASIQQ